MLFSPGFMKQRSQSFQITLIRRKNAQIRISWKRVFAEEPSCDLTVSWRRAMRSRPVVSFGVLMSPENHWRLQNRFLIGALAPQLHQDVIPVWASIQSPNSPP